MVLKVCLLWYCFQFHAEVELPQGPIIPKEGKVVKSKAHCGQLVPFITSELKFQGKNVYKVGAGILPGFNFCINLGSVPVDFDILCAPFYETA